MTDALTEHDAPRAPGGGGEPTGSHSTAVDDEFWAEGTRRRSGGESGPGRLSRAWTRFVNMPLDQLIMALISFMVVGGCVLFVFFQLQPEKLFSDTTPAGGDMGAHVWGPAYLRDHLLTKGRLAGWTPDWYAGFPAFQFYMVLPSLAIALLSLVIPYGVAFKLVAVSGCISLPFAAYFFGRMARLPFPAPPLLAVGATLFLFDRSFSIYGGNIPSTLAGEFAFSISLSFSLLYLGVLARGLETGKHRGWVALLLALTGLCHVIPFIFALVGTLLWFLLRPGLAQLRYLITSGPVAGLLMSFWYLPFYLRSGYMNDMGWEKIESDRWRNYLFDRDRLDPQLVNLPDLRWVVALAAVGLLLSLVYRRRAGIFLSLTAITFAIAFMAVPQGRLWNARLLPFYYLALYMLAAVGIAELGRLLSSLFARDINRPIRTIAAATPVLGCIAALSMLGMSLHWMPFGRYNAATATFSVGPDWSPLSTKDRSFIDSWAIWNFDGYEGYDQLPARDATGAVIRDANGNVQLGPPTYTKSWPEFHDLIATMKDVGSRTGCGRAMWEHEEQHNRYGTPMALMLLPFWTDGCIGSMEGLYFEASATTPYHFLNQDELSWAPSNAQRDLPYGPGAPTPSEFNLGVKHLQMMGVTYYLAISENIKVLAAQNPALRSIATSGPWTVYSVADAPLVEALTNQPAVLTGQATTGHPWLDTSVCWYQNQASWDVVLTDRGPASWQQVNRTVQPPQTAAPAEKCEPKSDWGWFDQTGGPEVRPVPKVEVSNIRTADDSISFDVSQPGTPVLIKTSYFPNWQVTGADGPYRATPNFMVVVPTSNHVELHYGYTGIDLGSYALSALGIIGLIVLFRLKPLKVKPTNEFWGRAERPDLYPSPVPDLRFGNDFLPSAASDALAAIVPTWSLVDEPPPEPTHSGQSHDGQSHDGRPHDWPAPDEPAHDWPAHDEPAHDEPTQGPANPASLAEPVGSAGPVAPLPTWTPPVERQPRPGGHDRPSLDALLRPPAHGSEPADGSPFAPPRSEGPPLNPSGRPGPDAPPREDGGRRDPGESKPFPRGEPSE